MVHLWNYMTFFYVSTTNGPYYTAVPISRLAHNQRMCPRFAHVMVCVHVCVRVCVCVCVCACVRVCERESG